MSKQGENPAPVTSGKADDSNLINRRYLDSILIEMRVLNSGLPDLKTTIFGEEFASPIMTPAFSHLNRAATVERDPMVEYAEAAKRLNVVNWVGMEPDEEYGKIAAAGARTVRIIKPFADHDLIRQQMSFARSHGAIAVGVDIDHIAGTDGKLDIADGIPLGPVTTEDLKGYVKDAGVPFVAKGVLSVHDALAARDAGVSGIVVSHHHGRIRYGVPPLAVLPAIRKALEGSGVHIFVDCGMDTGLDAYKALALGAEAVSVGRGILAPLLKDGADGVVRKITRMNQELSEMMIYTAIKDTKSFDPTVLHFVNGQQPV